MRIAFFVGGFPAISETFILRQITSLIDLGHEVDIYAERQPKENGLIHPDVLSYDLLARTTYTHDDMPLESAWEMPVWPLSGRTRLPGFEKDSSNAVRALRAAPAFFRCLLAAPRLTFEVLDPGNYGHEALSLSSLHRLATLSARRADYDVLHAHFGPQGNSFRFARKLWKAPLLVSFHGNDFSAFPRQEGSGVYRLLFETVDAVTVNTDFVRERVEDLGCPADKIHKLPSSLNPDDFPFKERVHKAGEPVRILTVGRLVEKKGIEYSIRAVAKVVPAHPDLQYDIVGDGPLRSDLVTLIRQSRLEKRVTLHGRRDSAYVRQMMDEAHLFILSSVTAADGDQESLAFSLVEAQASGLPVLATRHNGFAETIVPDQSGFLVPERDVDRLADRLAYLIEHPEFWPEMGRAGRAHVEHNYDLRRVTPELVKLYERLKTQQIR